MCGVCEQMDLLKTTVHLLHGQTDNCLTKIDRLFQDSPTEGVGVYYMYVASWTCMCVCVHACVCVCMHVCVCVISVSLPAWFSQPL